MADHAGSELKNAASIKETHGLDAARMLTRVLSVAGFALAFWLVFFPVPYRAVVYLAMAWPVLVIIGALRYQGLIHFDAEKSANKALLIPALTGPAWGLALRALFDMGNLLAPQAALAPVAVTCVAASLAILLIIRPAEPSLPKRAAGILGVVLTMAGYSFGLCLLINRMHDESKPQSYEARVLSKNVSRYHGATYYMILDHVGPQSSSEEARVHSELFNKVNIGSTVRVFVGDGALRIPWYYVTE